MRAGDTFDRYVIEDTLGEGGMGRVYRAVDSRLQRKVALKVLRIEQEGNLDHWRDAAARMLREARAAAALDHPNAISIFDVGEVDGAPFIAMELITGQSLRAYVGDTGIPWERKARWLMDVASALAAAHAAGLVHRDIKPENIMLREDGRIKVLDFGIARRANTPAQGEEPTQSPQGIATLTGQGVMVGTLRYMPPEQLAARPIDGRADQFAWAVTAYELLAGVAPWPSNLDAVATISSILTQPPMLLAPLVPGLAPEVESALTRALSKSPDDRFPTMGEIVALLEPFASASVGRVSIRVAAGPGPGGGTTTDVDPHGHTAQHRPLTERAMSLDAPQPLPASTTAGAAVTSPEATTPNTPRTRRAGKAALAALIGAGALACAVLAGRRLGGGSAAVSSGAVASASPEAPTPAGSAAPTTVLIAGIDNRTGDPLLDGTLPEIFYATLRRSSRLDPIAGSEVGVLAAELDPERQTIDDGVAKKLAARGAVHATVLRGSILAKGAAFAIKITVTDAASSRVILSTTRETSGGDAIVTTAGLLAYDVLEKLGDPLAKDGTARTGMSTSLEADHEYAVARGMHRAGRDEVAIVHAERATAVDPQFAKAHAMLALLLNNRGRKSESLEHARLALRWVDRMGERDRLKFLGDYYLADTGEYDKAIAAYDELLRSWPTDAACALNRAYAFAYQRNLSHALELAKSVASEHPKDQVVRGDLPTFYVWANDFEAATREVRAIESDFAQPDYTVFVYLGLARALLGHDQEARDAYARAAGSNASRAADALADLAVSEGRLDEAAAILDQGIVQDTAAKNNDELARKWALWGEVRLRRKDLAGALAAAEKAESLGDSAPLYAAAMIDAAAGAEKKATAIAAKLAEDLAPDPRLYARLIQAEVLRLHGKPREAVAGLAEARHTVESWLVHFQLGRAYLDAGAFAEAYTELKWCLARRGEGATAFLDELPTLRYVALVTYYLGRAQEGLGSPDAADSYRAFVATNSGAEHDPVTDDARKRLAGR